MRSKVDALNRFLFEENGFHGSRLDYYHQANSYMNRVIDDRVGLPITLSILYMELGKRIGLDVRSVPLPGHFVVKVVDGKREQLIDVFDNAKKMSFEQAKTLVGSSVGTRVSDEQLTKLTRGFMDSATQKSVFIRLITNLRGLAERDQQNQRLLRYFEALVLTDPNNPEYRGLRAVVRFQEKRYASAIEDLDWFFEAKPDGIDLNEIENLRSRFLQQSQQYSMELDYESTRRWNSAADYRRTCCS